MPLRFPLLLKKRGRRRTGSPGWARAAEVLYNLLFVAFGAIGVWWTLHDVLLPELHLIREARTFREGTCTVLDRRVVTRPGLAEAEYCPELLVRFDAEPGQAVTVWTRHGVGRDAPSPSEAERFLERFEVGESRPVWFDPRSPTNPDRVLLSVHRRWWPWFVLSIPVSLALAGLFGFAQAVAGGQASPERRASAVTAAVRAAPPAAEARAQALALPPTEPIGENPGVRLAYRLPMDGALGWRVLGMACVCVLWNALAAVFVYQLAIERLSVGGSVGLAAAAVAPLAATGAWLTYSLWRDARSVGGAGVTRVEIARHPLAPGETAEGLLLQSGVAKLRALTISLVCEEVATYRQGTDTRTAVAEVRRLILHRERGAEVSPGEPLERRFLVTIPAGGPVSFASPHNEVRWLIEVAVGSPRWPQMRRRYRLCVYPESVTQGPAPATEEVFA